jgi:uncharacterized protein (TIGR03083 family)
MQASAALHHSHDRLVAALSPLGDDEVAGPSYDDEWSVAQVASHLGSGAEIFSMLLDAGLGRGPTPGPEQFQPIWEVWNAKSAPLQARDALAADAGFLERVDAMSADEREALRLDLFGSEQSLEGLLRLRLGEHALHTWDIAVSLDPAATVPDDAAELIIDNMPGMVERVGRGVARPAAVHVVTTRPDRAFLLELTPGGARLTPYAAKGTPEAAATLRTSGEAFIRLVYGRLDPDHTPESLEMNGTAPDVDLDLLRRAFPGF